MEFNSSGFFTAIGIDVFYSVNIWYIFDNFDNSVKFINLNYINELLLEEFSQSNITLISKFRILFEEFLHLNSEHVDKMFCSCV